jgi:UDP-glucose 4-epimerase
VNGVPSVDKNTPRSRKLLRIYKTGIERILHWYDRLKGLRYAALRYFNAAGYDIEGRITGLEIKPENLLPVVMETASGVRSELSIFGNDYDTPDGTCIRDYVHVSDLADAHIRALDYISNENSSIMVNLGSENGISVKTMVEKAREITGREIPSRIAPNDRYAPSWRFITMHGSSLDGRRVQYPETLIETWKVYQNQLSLNRTKHLKANLHQIFRLLFEAFTVGT